MIDLYTKLATVNLWSLVYKKDLHIKLLLYTKLLHLNCEFGILRFDCM
jgi:hypothetical protein